MRSYERILFDSLTLLGFEDFGCEFIWQVKFVETALKDFVVGNTGYEELYIVFWPSFVDRGTLNLCAIVIWSIK